MTRALALATLLAANPPVARAAGLDVVTTSTDAAAIVAAVGGDRVSVTALAPPLHDPHAVELKPAQAASLRSAALVVRIGLDHEPWLARAARAAGAAPREVVDLSRAVRVLATDRPRVRDERGTHVHALGNPHYWLDPANGAPMAAEIAAALARLAPGDRDRFEDNRRRFVERLEAALPRWTTALAPHRGTRVVVVHDTWPYFAARFGLAIVATVEPQPGVAPTPAALAALTERMRVAGIRLVVADPYSSASLVRHVAAKTGARAVTLVPSVGGDPAATDYVALFDVNVGRLAAALGAR